MQSQRDNALNQVENVAISDNNIEHIQLGKEGFDPFKKAEANLAEVHRRSRLVRKVNECMKDPSAKRCECCGFPVDAVPYSLWCSLNDLGNLGPGFPLYYTFIKILGAIFMLGICVVALPCTITNVNANNGSGWQEDQEGWITKASVGNNGSSGAIFPFWQCILHIVYMIGILTIFYIGSSLLKKQEFDIDLNTVTPKDYTVHAYGLPLDIQEAQVRELFENYSRYDKKKAKVIKVNFPYKIHDYMENLAKYEDIKEKLRFLEIKAENPELYTEKKGCGCAKTQSKEELEANLAVVEANILKFENNLPTDVGENLLIGQAFVTFETQVDARSVDYKYSKHWVQRFWYAMLISLFGCCAKKNNLKKISREISAKLAHEPSDIFWENLEISFQHRIRSTLKTYLITALAILVSFAAVYGMKVLSKHQLSSYHDKANLSTLDNWKIRLYSIWPSICIIMINFILGRSTRYFSSFERPHSITDLNISVAIKLTIAMFFNTALVTLIVNYDWSVDWFQSGGLVQSVTYILFSNAFISPLIYLFSPVVLAHKLRMYKVKKGRVRKSVGC